ncbi:putative PurR-regulated permease PerM [Microterricola gilva]|uniref:Putative PurR-regulated permease PerM n=1 Tax=Microterricola gilva TaxID=393267 RepID=A0A4Q8ARQ6_9MICO|nr:AI-2E family transporter [Microterricola gilva]RZU66843.1 putative PurR-regulated permease PerM [Microterricola gilva]
MPRGSLVHRAHNEQGRAAARNAVEGKAPSAHSAHLGAGSVPRSLRQREKPSMFHTRPLVWGFTVTIGVLIALVLALTLYNLGSVLISVFAALFISLGLDPLIRWFQKLGMPRAWALVTVIALIVAMLATILLIIIPLIIEQVQQIVTTVPQQVAALEKSGWFTQLDENTGGLVGTVVDWVQKTIADPKFWATVGGGALQVGFAVTNALSSGFFVAILTIWFVATLDTMKTAAYSLVAASKREVFSGYANRIMDSVGRYLSGMVILAFINSVFSVILLSLVGVHYAFIIGVAVFFITLIPLVGTVITTAFMTVIALFVSPTAALITLLSMLVYMQVEAYILTPRVMSKAVQVPGSIVLISALAGGTLAGLGGALVAIPVSAGIILLIREVLIPAKQRQ